METVPYYKWNKQQQFIRSFWIRWSEEYIVELYRAAKWKHRTRNLQVGDLVIVLDVRLGVTRWPLGRFISVVTGSDGRVRVVTVRTQNGQLKLTARKLALLLPAEHVVKALSLGGEDVQALVRKPDWARAVNTDRTCSGYRPDSTPSNSSSNFQDLILS